MALDNSITTFAESVGLSIDESFAYGVFEGFFITVYNESYDKAAFINYYKNEEDTEGANEENIKNEALSDFEFSGRLQSLFSQYNVKKNETYDNGVYFTTSESLIKFRELIEETIKILKESGHSGALRCSSCGESLVGSAFRVYKERFNYLVCSECASSLLEEQEDAEDNDKEKAHNKKTSKAFGIALIFLFAISALMIVIYRFLLPAVPVLGNMLPGYPAVILPFAMTALTVWSFKTFSEKKIAFVIPVSFGMSLIFTVCTQYICSVIQFVRSGARTISEAKAGVYPLTSTQLSNAAGEILKTVIIHDTEWYMFYKYLIVDVCAVAIAAALFGIFTLENRESPVNVEEFDPGFQGMQ